MSHRDKRFVYHMTSLDNLSSIARNGLLSRDEVLRRRLLAHDVADQEILAGRGGLSSMVPFHFLTPNPFDYGVIRNPENATKRFVHLAVERAYAQQNGWQIIPRHPLAGGGSYELLDWATGFEQIDWEQLDKRGNWATDRECKLACMAEAVASTAVPIAAVTAVFCQTEDDVKTVAKLVPQAWCKANPGMFPRKGGS
jgi:hypothetical protein